MFNKDWKLNSEITEVISSFMEGNHDPRIRTQSKQQDQRTADSINLLLDEFANLKSELATKKNTGEEMNCSLILSEVSALVEAATEGRLDSRIQTESFTGESKKMFELLNELLDTIIGPLNVSAEYIDRISKGDIPEKITDEYKGDFNEIKNNLNQCIDAVNALVEDSLMLSEAGVAGQLDTRADAEKHNGDFRRVVEGVNDCLDAVIGPLNVTAEYVDRISKGDIPEKITDDYNGDFNEIKNNLNQCIDAVNALVEDSLMLSEAGVAGQLDTRADTAKHAGDFRRVVDGVNGCLDAVIGPLNVTAEYVDRISKGDIPEKITDDYNGDFNEIKNNLNQCIDAVNALVEDSLMLSEAGVAGLLDTRADAAKHSGDFRRVVEGVNDCLDAVIGPLNVTAEYVDRISKGDIPEKITDDYNGDFNEIKNNLNQCIDSLNALLGETDNLIDAAVAGKLATRGDAGMFNGKFADLVSNINLVIDTLVGHIDQIPAPFMIIDNDFSIAYMNRTGASVIGKEPVELIGQKCYDNFRTSDCNTDKCACGRAMKTGRSESSETDAHPGGKDLVIEYNGVPIRNRSGEIIGALEIVMDKTAEKTALEEAGIKADYLEKVPTPVMVVDKDFNIQFMNGVGAAAVGSTPEGCVGQKCFDLFNTGHCNTENCQVAKAMKTDSICTNDTIAKLPSGELPIRYSGAPLKNEDGEIIGGLEYVLDISKEMEITKGVHDLVEAAIAGRLDERADASSFEGNYRQIIEGVNATLDSVIGPLNVAAEYIDRISKGDIPEKIADEYQGDFNEIKNNINQCIDAVDLLVNDAVMLANAGIEGKLSTRADTEKHSGDFRKIVEGVNNCLDAIVTPIEETSRVIEEYSSGNLHTRVEIETRGDLRKLADTLNGFGQELQAIISDSNAVLDAIANNDLTCHSRIQGAGEFRKFTDGVENCRRSLNDIVSTVMKDAQNIAATAEQMSGSSAEIATSANEVSATVEEISRGAQVQSSKSEEVARTMVDMTQSVQEVAANSQRTAESSIASNELIQNLGTVAQSLQQKMNGIKSASEESSQHINDLAEKSNQIGEIVQLITNIADQTNLLALNAAIEAARAGEHGRGFAVVADEVRKLAEDSGNAAKQIATLIHAMQEGTTNAVSSMEQASSEVATGAQSLDEAVGSIDSVVESGNTIVKMVQEIAAAAEQQSASIQEVTASIEEVSSISEESAAGTEEASAAVEQQTASMQELTASAQQLADVASEMRSVVSKFRIDNGSSASRSSQISASEDEMTEKKMQYGTLIV
ncbi:methyl-accepting chemotaxis protein [Methanolobus sp. WCC4]|uniref:methyl-accepting chemotaxis protein n=1 Tax=Methanolobus sp. WCC4 TaxID=3125784 RepID=UPI0030F5E9FE